MVNGTLDWITFRPATAIGTVATYVAVPTFSYTGISWKGASEVVTQFNFTASKNFVLKNRPTPPSGVNYCLCIRYRVGSVVYRWKLWQDVGEVLNVPLYNGEVIKKNFVLEVWNVLNSTTVSNAAALNIITSVISVPTNFRNLAATALATGTEVPYTDVAISGSTEVETNFSPSYRWRADGYTSGATDWPDKTGGYDLLANAFADLSSTAKTSSDSAIQNRASIATAVSSGATGITSITANCYAFYALIKINAWNSGRRLFSTNAFVIEQAGSSPAHRITWLDDGSTTDSIDIPVADGNYYLIGVLRDRTKSYFILYDKRGVATGTFAERANTSGQFSLQNISIGISGVGQSCANFSVAEIIAFASGNFAISGLSNYLTSYYSEALFTLPATINTGSAWLDNT